jgi:hypothetical protein
VLPQEPINIIIWMIWGFIFAATIFIFSRKFNLWQTTPEQVNNEVLEAIKEREEMRSEVMLNN